MNRYKDKEYLKEQLELGKSYSQIAKENNTTNVTIQYWVKKFGLSSKYYEKKKAFPFVDKKWLEENWLNTDKSLQTLANELGCSVSLLEWRAASYGLKKPYKYKIDMTKLKDISDPVLNYLAGLVATDGWLWKDKHYVEIDLVGDDELQLLKNLNSYYGNTRPVKTFKNKAAKNGCSHRLTFSAEGIKEVFINHFNLTDDGNKTFNLKTPKSFSTEDCARMYLRGVIDGDGSIYVGPDIVRCSVNIVTASFDFIQGLCDIVERYIGIKVKPQIHRDNSKNAEYPSFYLGGSNCFKFLHFIYRGYPDFRLERKYKKYEEIKSLWQ